MAYDYPSAVFLLRGVICMAEFTELTTVIGNYAFPIMCCIYLFWSQYHERKMHQQSLDKLTEALQNNTIAINDLKGMIQHVQDR